MEITLCWFIVITLLCLFKILQLLNTLEHQQTDLKYYKELAKQFETDRDQFRKQTKWLEYQNSLLKEAVRLNEKTKEIPKGTIQAVKEAMKRSHPDNGGNAEDFQMYRRAYNVLTGKEKL